MSADRIVSLPDRATVGCEALARVFAHACDIGTVDEVDRLCIDAAIAAVLQSPSRRGALSCVNAEPAIAYGGRLADSVLALGHGGLTVMVEITERSPLAHPVALLRKVAAPRMQPGRRMTSSRTHHRYAPRASRH